MTDNAPDVLQHVTVEQPRSIPTTDHLSAMKSEKIVTHTLATHTVTWKNLQESHPVKTASPRGYTAYDSMYITVLK